MARFLYRVGVFSARHRLLVIIAWLAVIATAATIALTGMKFTSGNFDIPGTESSKALTIVDKEFPQPQETGRGSLQLVLEAPAGEKITSAKNAALLSTWIDEARALRHVDSVTNPLDPRSPRVSSDGTTAIATVHYESIDDATAKKASRALEQLAGDARGSGFTAEVGGTIASLTAASSSPSEVIGVLIAFLVLVLTFGSLLAAGANMLSSVIGVGVGALVILASSAFSPIGTTTLTLAVMLGLAVGIDYGLFVLARVRSELREGRSVPEAIGQAVGTAGTAVVFAGFTVIIALTGLSVVNIPFITEMGLAGAAGVLVAVLVSLTLLPAITGFIGVRVLSRRDRKRLNESAPDTTARSFRIGFLDRWGAFVVRRPLTSLISAVVVLGVLSVPVLSLTTSLTVPGGENPDSTQRRAYDLISEKFGAGYQSPMIVLVTGDRVSESLPDVTHALESLKAVELVAPGTVTKDDRYGLLTVIPTHGPVSSETRDLVHEIRARSASVDGVSLSVTGQTAISIDVDARLSNALGVYIAVIVGLSIVLLILLFRSLLVPVVATLGFLLSVGAAIGVTVAIFQWGWFDAIISAPQGNPLMSMLPLLIVGILFGLAMDYQVFLVSRIHEAHTKGLPPKEAILDGFSRSAFVVVAAALIMFAVFGGFGLSDMSTVASIGVALGVGVLADAFVVRMVIMPAVLSLTGGAAWWIPRWLDRILPHINSEGKSLGIGTPETSQDQESEPTPVR